MRLWTIIICILILNFKNEAQIVQIQQKINQIKPITSFLRNYQNFGIKMMNTEALENSRKWLQNELTNHSISYSLDTFVYGSENHYNIIVYNKGEIDSTIIVGAHYDTQNGPGVNDNGTGIYALFQSILILSKIDLQYNVMFVFFSGEEVGFIGSKHIVNVAIPKLNIKVKYMLNLDQLGGNINEINNQIKCEKDNMNPNNNNLKSEKITNKLANAITLYTDLQTIITNAYSSDYIPFQDQGYIITGLYQANSFPFYHTENDVLLNLDTNATKTITKGLLAFLINEIDKSLMLNIKKCPCNVNIINYLGQKVDQIYIQDESQPLVFNYIKSGHYILEFKDLQNNLFYKKIIYKQK